MSDDDSTSLLDSLGSLTSDDGSGDAPSYALDPNAVTSDPTASDVVGIAQTLKDPDAADIAGVFSAAIQQTDLGKYVLDAEKIVGAGMRVLSEAQKVNAAFGGDPTGEATDYTGAIEEKRQQAILSAFTAICTAIGGPYMGLAAGAFQAFIGAVGPAHPGPGVCKTDPPAAADWPTLKSWRHYTDWAHSAAGGEPYGPDKAGSFEAYANKALEYNRALQDNCYGDLTIAPAVLLASLITAWNTSHYGPSRVVTRKTWDGNIGANSVPAKWDPIAYALTETGNYSGKTISFVINDGPMQATTTQEAIAQLWVWKNYGVPSPIWNWWTDAQRASARSVGLNVEQPKVDAVGVAQAVGAQTGAPPPAVATAVKKVITMHLAPPGSPAAQQAIADIQSTQAAAAKALLAAAHANLITAPSFWVAYYAQQARTSPLPASHPYARTIALQFAAAPRN